MSMFQKAQRKKAKLRLGLEGPSGSGKTYSGLLIARGLAPNGNIAVIDTENSSASLYSHLTEFDVAELEPPYTPERYIELIEEASKHYDVLIIDSISHEWRGKGGILEIHDNMPGNSFQNWAKVNPRHDAFMQAMLQAPCHIIATMRSKETYLMQEQNGKQQVKKAGMEALQRDGVIYEFTTVLTLDISNQATRNKDRTGIFHVDRWFVPSEETGQMFKDWLEGGAEPPRVDLDALGEQVEACESIDDLKNLYSEWKEQINHAINRSDANTLFNNRKATLSQQTDSSSSQFTQQQQNQNPGQGSGNNSKQANSGAQLITQKQQQLLNSQLGVLGYKDKQDRLDWINAWLERQGLDYVQESTKELTKDTGSKVIEAVKTEVQKQHDEGNPLNGNSEDMDEDLFREPAQTE